MVDPLPDLPVLGEPLIAELANTQYSGPSGVMDVFDRSSWTADWFRRAPCARGFDAPARFDSSELSRLRELRDALRVLLERQGDIGPAVDVINAAYAAARPQRVLEPSATGVRIAVKAYAEPFDSLLCTIASHLLDAVEQGDLDRVERCRRPTCTLYFVPAHHRRRYCNPRCANAHRQSRYHQRVRVSGADR